MAELVPPDFEVPLGMGTSEFVLEPLGPEHRAGLSRLDVVDGAHRGDAGFPVGHLAARDDAGRKPRRPGATLGRLPQPCGFTYTVLDPADRDVIGCVDVYPVRNTDHEAHVLSWTRQSHAHLDTPLRRAVGEWLASDSPFANVRYGPRK